jgi:hypothetical protein
MTTRHAPLLVAISVFAPLVLAGSADAQPYRVEQLAPAQAPVINIAHDVNDNGVVALIRKVAPTAWRSDTWTTTDGLQPLTSDPRFALAYYINNAGQVAGEGCPNVCPNPPSAIAIWSPATGVSFTPLWQVRAINASGTVLGSLPSGEPAIVRPGEAARVIPGVVFGADMNDLEQVVGHTASGDVFVWTVAGGAVPVPRLPQHAGTEWSYNAEQINNAGQVVGKFGGPNFQKGLFAWTPSTGTVLIPFPAGLPPVFEVDGIDLNDHGHLVASFAGCCQDVPVPYLFKNGGWTNLRTLVPADTEMVLGRTAAINNNGWIVGQGFLGNDDDFPGAPYLLIPQPVGVDITANGQDGPLVLAPNEALQIDLKFEANEIGTLPAAEIYLGAATATGVVWFHPTTGFSLTPTPMYQGPLTSFGPVPLLQVANAESLGPGPVAWFMIVDHDTNGAVNAHYFDLVVTSLSSSAGGAPH